MTRSLIIILIVILSNLFAIGQTAKKFIIFGETTFFDTIELTLAPAIFTPNNEYNDNKIPVTNIKVIDGKFRIEGEYNYTVPLQFSYLINTGEGFMAKMSDLLFVDSDTILIKLGSLDSTNHFGSLLTSTSNIEYNNLKKLYKHLEVFDGNVFKADDDRIREKDLLLEKYVERNPNSLVAMWVLIYDYQLYGFSEDKYRIARRFASNIGILPTFRTLIKKMEADKSLTKGNPFPLKDFQFLSGLSKTITTSKYTLVDFWASYCEPCIRQFPEFITIHQKFRNSGFNIYSVSTDKRDRIVSAKRILKSQGIPWQNSFDINGQESFVYNIIGIPRNFLVDNKGTIVETDISGEKLEAFLNDHLQ